MRAAHAAFLALVGALAMLAASPAPKPSSAIDLLKLQPKGALPKVALHADYVVEVNKLGQVTRVDAAHRSSDAIFNTQTEGNALQAFIRTSSGKAVVGKYRLSYDYSPSTQRVRRSVDLVQRGGVDPNAVGAVAQMEKAAQQHRAAGQSPPPGVVPPVRYEKH